VSIKLIPKEYTGLRPEERTWAIKIWNILKAKIFKKSLLNLYLGIVISLLIVSSLLYVGFRNYNNSLEQKKNDLQKKIEELQNKRDPELEKKIPELQKRIKFYEDFLNSRIYASNIFELLEKLTVSKVQYTGFDADFKNYKLSLNSLASDYNNLAKQLSVFENTPQIKKVEVSNIRLTENGVEFNLEIEFDKEVVMKPETGSSKSGT